MPGVMTPSRAKLRSPSSWKRNCSKLCRCRGETKSLSLRPIESWKLSMRAGRAFHQVAEVERAAAVFQAAHPLSSSPCTIFIGVSPCQSGAVITTASDRRRRGQEVLDRVPQEVPVLAVARAVRGLRQDDELAVAVRKLGVELQQVRVGRVAVPDAAQHQHRRQHLLRIDDRQVRRHVEIGAGRDRVAELHLRRDDRLRHRRIERAGMAVAGEDRADHRRVALPARVGAQFVDARPPPRDLGRAVALVGEGRQISRSTLGLRLREGAARMRARRRAVHVHLAAGRFPS